MADLFGHAGTIKALSLWEPWASLVAAGVKRHETRHWSTSHRGLIAIHAAKRVDVAGSPDTLCEAALGPDWARTRPIGCVVAVARLTSIHDAASVRAEITRADLAAGNFAPGRFAWRLCEVRRLCTPIPSTGRQGLFTWEPPEDLRDRLEPAVDHAEACAALQWRF